METLLTMFVYQDDVGRLFYRSLPEPEILPEFPAPDEHHGKQASCDDAQDVVQNLSTFVPRHWDDGLHFAPQEELFLCIFVSSHRFLVRDELFLHSCWRGEYQARFLFIRHLYT